MSAVGTQDRVGLGWRPELAAGIFAHLDEIDVIELIADDHFGADRRQRRALRTLARQVPVVLHGVGLGLASTAPVESARLDALARLVEDVEPVFWSEHLAFVRAGGVEIGHLAAPPRCAPSVDGLARNLERARARVGSTPLVENVATLIDPPGSDRDEASWLCDCVSATGADLLLDLHNLHANAVNFGFDALSAIERLPAARVTAVHLAGGRWVAAEDGTRRLLDDHLHDVPDPVFALLEEVARRAPGPLSVILERDGSYPPMSALLCQLERARAALARGRTRPTRALPTVLFPRAQTPTPRGGLDQAFLARLYVDPAWRARVLADPDLEGQRAGLSSEACATLARLDRPGLELAARSFARKRAKRMGGASA